MENKLLYKKNIYDFILDFNEIHFISINDGKESVVTNIAKCDHASDVDTTLDFDNYKENKHDKRKTKNI